MVQSYSEIIQANPIGEHLDVFRSSFGTSQSLDTINYEDLRNLTINLLLTLLGLQASRLLPSNANRKILFNDILILSSAVHSDTFDFDRTKPLLNTILANKPDQEIWDQVYNAVTESTPPSQTATTPIAYEKAILDTPLRCSSASQRGAEQTHHEVDQRIIEELKGRAYYNVGGFIKRYFEGKSWSNSAKDICEKSMKQHTEGRWSGCPEPALQGPFFDWFMKFQDSILSGLNRRYYTSANKVLKGSEAPRKLDIFLAPANIDSSNDEHDWSNVLVIGEHKQNPNEDNHTDTLIQLAGYAREVFGSQPDRRFIPGFTICGSLMRLWIFDRSGSYNSENFDIHKTPEQFATVIAGYGLMTGAELGLNTFIERSEHGRYIIAQNRRIYLEDKPIALQKAIACRGTTCYRGKAEPSKKAKWEYVVKFAWPSDKRQQEGRLLKLAKERGVKGIAEWLHHEQITIDGNPDTIANLRQVMEFDKPRKLSSKASWIDSGAESSRVSKRESLRGRSKSNISRLTSSGRKRKIADDFDGSGTRKRSKSNDGQSDPSKVQSNQHKPDVTSFHTIQEAKSDSLAGNESETYGNRIHYCLVISPAGRPLQDYGSIRELLEALRDAIEGHRSLLKDGKILHRDISENNIIITEAVVEGDPKGILIDLDLAKELNSIRSNASHRTGTMQFMAIEVLQGKGHTYRHDLESFFYVLIWMCIRYGHDTGHKTLEALSISRLRRWYIGTYAEISDTKLGHMDKNAFENIIAEFVVKSETLKGLARELRSVLFPIKDGAIFTGTFRDSDIMYNGMIKAFDGAIDLIAKEEQANA